MAFRGYELNLMLRVQDRASTRLRRLAADMGGINRAAQTQRQMQRTSESLARNQISQMEVAARLQSHTNADGADALRLQSRLNSNKATEIGYSQKLKQLGWDLNNIKRVEVLHGQSYARMLDGKIIPLTAKQEQLVRRGLAARQSGLSIRAAESALMTRMNAQMVALVAEEELLALASAQTAAEFEKQARAERIILRSRAMIHTGSVAFMFGGIGLGAAAGLSSAFANFNRESVKAATQMRGIDESFASTVTLSKDLQNVIEGLTREFPASMAEMAQSAYNLASGMDLVDKRGIPLKTGLERLTATTKLLKAANQVAVAGGIDLETATEALIVTFNNFDPSLQNVEGTLNTLFSTVRFGKGTFAEFAPVFGRMATFAKAGAQSLTEAGGAVAFLSQRLSQTQAVTAYIRLLQIMQRKEFLAGFEDIFKTPATTKVGGIEQLKSLSEIINTIVTRAPQLTKGGTQLTQLIQTITARGQDLITGRPGHAGLESTQFAKTALFNLINDWEQYLDTLSNVSSNQKEFNESLKAGMQAPGIRWQVALNQFKAFAIIIGEEVLPKVLTLFDYVGDLAHRIETLSPRTRTLIGNILVWGSALAVVGGFISIVAGGIAILFTRFGHLLKILGIGGGAGLIGRFVLLGTTIRSFGAILASSIALNGVLSILTGGVGALFARLKALATGAALTSGKFATLLGFLRKIAAIGVITLVIKTLWGGDPSARDFLMGALAGGILGWQFGGPIGAVIGAITVPVAIKLIADWKKPKIPPTPVEVAYKLTPKRGGLDKPTVGPGGRFLKSDFEKFKQQWERELKQWKVPASVDMVERNRQGLHKVLEQNKRAASSIRDRWEQLAAELTGIDVFKGLTEQAVTAAANIELVLARAVALGNVAVQQSALRKQIAWDRAEIARLERLPKTAARIKRLVELYGHLGSAYNQLDATLQDVNKREDQLAQTRQRAKTQAEADKLDSISRAADNLVNKYQELEQANKAFFQLFGGPISQGPIAQMYNTINQMLQGFGVDPIPIPITLQTQDIESQLRSFDMFTKGLDRLRKRGMPREMLEEYRGKGIEALPLIRGLEQAPPQALKFFIKKWRESQKVIQTRTKKDMNDTLALWKSYGNDIAWSIVQGLASDKAQATLKAGYEKYIAGTFSSQLTTSMNKAIQEAVTNWLKENPEGVQEPKTTPRPPIKGTSSKTGSKPKPASTASTTSASTTIYHGDTITIHADSSETARAVQKALNKASYTKKLNR